MAQSGKKTYNEQIEKSIGEKDGVVGKLSRENTIR